MYVNLGGPSQSQWSTWKCTVSYKGCSVPLKLDIHWFPQVCLILFWWSPGAHEEQRHVCLCQISQNHPAHLQGKWHSLSSSTHIKIMDATNIKDAKYIPVYFPLSIHQSLLLPGTAVTPLNPFRWRKADADCPPVPDFPYSWFDSSAAMINLITVPVILNASIHTDYQMRCHVLNLDLGNKDDGEVLDDNQCLSFFNSFI